MGIEYYVYDESTHEALYLGKGNGWTIDIVADGRAIDSAAILEHGGEHFTGLAEWSKGRVLRPAMDCNDMPWDVGSPGWNEWKWWHIDDNGNMVKDK